MFWDELRRPFLALAPLADYSDLPFGLICRKFGAQAIFREMVSCDAIIHQNETTIKMLKIHPQERPVIQQIFGRDPEKMAEAAKIICKISQPDGLDINMGCPSRQLIKNFQGAALMKEPRLAAEIVRTVKKTIKIPLSVKTRLGWSKPEEILSFAPLLAKAGLDVLSVHGRTKSQGFTGPADWSMIGRVKKILKIPVLANGGIFTPSDLKNCLKISRADGVLIARGALGNPWIFQQLNRAELTGSEIKKMILKHARLEIKHYGRHGLILFRKHLVHYLKGLPASREIKKELLRAVSWTEFKLILNVGF